VTRPSWWIAGLALHKNDKNWLVPLLVWLLPSVRLATLHISTKFVTEPVAKVCKAVSEAPKNVLCSLGRMAVLAIVVAVIILTITYTTPQTTDNTLADRTISLTGLVVTVLAFWATSRHRKHINWRTVLVGILVQFLVGVFVMRSNTGVRLQNSLIV